MLISKFDSKKYFGIHSEEQFYIGLDNTILTMTDQTRYWIWIELTLNDSGSEVGF